MVLNPDVLKMDSSFFLRPSMTHLFAIGLVAIVIHFLYNRYASPLRKYPGPVFASCSRLWQVWAVWSGRAEELYIEAHQRYGPIVRLGPNEISFSSPTAGLDIFKTGKGFHKSKFYTVFLPDNIKDIFTEIREPVHAAKKRFASPPYSLASVKQQTQQLEEVMSTLFSILDQGAAADPKSTFDLGDWIYRLTFDILAQFAFGQPFNFTDSGPTREEFLYRVARSQYESAIIGQMPFIEKLTRSNPLCKYIPFLPPDKLRVMPDTATAVLHKHQDLNRRGLESPSCLLKSLLQVHEKNPDAFEMKDVLAVSMGAMWACLI